MKLNSILPFVAVVLTCNAIGQQTEPATGQPSPGPQPSIPPARQRVTSLSLPAVPASPSREPRLFDFPGGTPADYLAAVDKLMGSHLVEIATIPNGAAGIVVQPVRARLVDAEDAIALYDSIPNNLNPATNVFRFGQWVTKKDPMTGVGDLRALIFNLPTELEVTRGSLDVRAISLRGVPEEKWKAMAELIEATVEEQLRVQAKLTAQSQPPLNVRIHPEAAMLVATGGKEQMEWVEKLATTMHASYAVRAEEEADAVQARAFSTAGLPPQIVKQIREEIVMRAKNLHDQLAARAEHAGISEQAGVFIFGGPEVIDSLQIMIVTGNKAGLEFAGSVIEQVKAALDNGTGKFVIVDGPGVRTQGSVPWTSKLTMLDAIAAAGGQAPSYGGDLQIRLTRGETKRILDCKEMRYDPAKNERVQPGDHLEVAYFGPQAKPTSAAPAEKP